MAEADLRLLPLLLLKDAVDPVDERVLTEDSDDDACCRWWGDGDGGGVAAAAAVTGPSMKLWPIAESEPPCEALPSILLRLKQPSDCCRGASIAMLPLILPPAMVSDIVRLFWVEDEDGERGAASEDSDSELLSSHPFVFPPRYRFRRCCCCFRRPSAGAVRPPLRLGGDAAED